MLVELIERASHGDREAFTSIAAANVDRCYALAYRILRDPHQAQDATQQALIGVWRDLPTLRDPSRFDAWLHRLVVHACYVESRGTRRWSARIRTLHVDQDPAPDLAGTLATRQQLETAFRQLSLEQRAVVVLHHYQGLALTEIAEMLGIPAGTVRSRLHHALKRLRTILDADDASTDVRGQTA